MNPDLYLRNNLIVSAFGVVGFLFTAWYLVVCFLLTLHNQIPHDSTIPLLASIAKFPNWIYGHTNYPVINLAWKYAVQMPIASSSFTSAHLILIGCTLLCALFGGISGEYFRAKAKVREYENEIKAQNLRRGVRRKHGVLEAPEHDINELVVNLSPHKPWHDSWWGKLFLMLVGGVIVTATVKYLGLK